MDALLYIYISWVETKEFLKQECTEMQSIFSCVGNSHKKKRMVLPPL